MLTFEMAGVLIYYVHSGGHCPSNDTLDNIQDVVAMDLIECMTNEDTQKRLKVEECLHHPYFWTTERYSHFYCTNTISRKSCDFF